LLGWTVKTFGKQSKIKVLKILLEIFLVEQKDKKTW
jgi:hypothetical protein